jgi:hypothetical protein
MSDNQAGSWRPTHPRPDHVWGGYWPPTADSSSESSAEANADVDVSQMLSLQLPPTERPWADVNPAVQRIQEQYASIPSLVVASIPRHEAPPPAPNWGAGIGSALLGGALGGLLAIILVYSVLFLWRRGRRWLTRYGRQHRSHRV